MTAISACAFAGAINARIAHGNSVTLIALRARSSVAGDRRSGRRLVRRQMRAGDVVMHLPSDDLYAVALLSDPRNGGDANDRHVRNAGRRIASVLDEATGNTFESAYAQIAAPLSARALRRILDEELRRHERLRELAGIAHELRSPVTSIRGHLELLLEPHGEVPARLRCLETARGELLRLSRMLDGIADISLLDGRAVGPAASCDVAPAVDHAVAAIRPRALARSVSLVVTHRVRGTARVAVDDCIRASVHVLQNAIDAGARTVQVASTCAGDRISVAIDDDGPGVNPQERRAIFACGRRGSAGSHYAGTGFGLAAVAAIVRSCGGSVSVRRSHLGGARFTLRFSRI